ncbi:probable cysteine desulfurase [Amphiura filiformis]|uniref:probable cysteine desulfurase n=1 Tax=Amphiura filiformis TaxID=82378 RepID=UPI003B220903
MAASTAANNAKLHFAGSNKEPNFLPHGVRKFYQLPESNKESIGHRKNNLRSINPTELFNYINENVIGRDFVFAGPWGSRTNIYCDYTASARSLQCIENYIQEQVLPVYGNTHTTTTVTSLQTTLYRHEARDIIRNAVNASEHDAVIFVGSGCTGAIHKLINGLNLKEPPVVLFGPYEHHSNLLPWRELGAEVRCLALPSTVKG